MHMPYTAAQQGRWGQVLMTAWQLGLRCTCHHQLSVAKGDRGKGQAVSRSHPLQALTPLQAARMLVESFPYLPDLIALVRELANERKAPSAEELLRNGAITYSEKQGAADVKVRCQAFDSQSSLRHFHGSPIDKAKTAS